MVTFFISLHFFSEEYSLLKLDSSNKSASWQQGRGRRPNMVKAPQSCNSVGEIMINHIIFLSQNHIHTNLHTSSSYISLHAILQYRTHTYIYIHTGWWFGTVFIFPYIGNISSSQLTLTPSFFRGAGLKPPYHEQIPRYPACRARFG